MRRFSLAIPIFSLVQADAWDSAEGPAVVPWAGPRPEPPPPPSPDRPSPPNKDLIDYDAFLDTIIQCTNKEMAIAKLVPEFVCRVFFYNFHKYPFINNDSQLLPNGHQFFRTINPNHTSKNTGLCVLSSGDSVDWALIVEGKVLKPGDVLWTHFATEDARLCDVHACQCLGDYNKDNDFNDLSHRTDDDYDAFLDSSYDKDDGLYDSYDGGCPRNLHNCPSNVSTDIIRGAGERNAPLQCQPASPPAATHTTVRPC